MATKAIRGQVALVVNVSLVTETCCVCGVAFAMQADFQKQRLEDRRRFYCPAGHDQVYTGPTEADGLRQKLADAERAKAWYVQQYDQHKAEIKDLGNQVRAQKAAKTRILNRVQNGVCPHCRRHFVNVERHMSTQHPEDR